MKNKIYKTSIIAVSLFAIAIAAQAQFPNFIKVDTGAITQLWGGHVSSACFDMDNDGDMDIVSSNKAVYVSNRVFSLFKNERNGYYVEMPEFTGEIELIASIGDIDNDGNIDLFVGPGYNFESVSTYMNSGIGKFQFGNTYYAPDFNAYPTLLDLDNDGYIDIVGINNWGCVLYNNGSGGFLPWADLGLFQEQYDIFLHGVSWGDPDDDGDFDFYGGYSSAGGDPINICLLNNGDESFTQFDPTSVIVMDTCDTPCVNWVDYDNDGDMDLYVQNMRCGGSLSAIYENLGDMQFTKHVIEDEIYRYSFTVSSVWGDLDNDADLDLYLTVENNEFPWPPFDTSATPYNVLYLNDGNGQFTNYLENHPLVTEDSHTAMLFDHDNDGDLDVLMTRYSWSNDGYNNLFVNEGNDNSWMVLTCEGTTSNRSAIGTRIQAKCFVNGNHITQTREITPINGHLSYANLRVHFGLREANVIDTLIIRWPSGIIDTYLDVAANKFYRVIENEGLSIDFKATNYIQYGPPIADPYEVFETTLINLKDHYHFMEGDTVPEIIGDTIIFSVYSNDNPGVVQAEVFYGYILKLQPEAIGESNIEILASVGFTERVDQFKVNVTDTLTVNERKIKTPQKFRIRLSPNPFTRETRIYYEISKKSNMRLEIYNYHGQLISILVDKIKTEGQHEILFDGSELPKGIYFCVLKTNGGIQTTKMIKL